jgi:hypothetical protein
VSFLFYTLLCISVTDRADVCVGWFHRFVGQANFETKYISEH